MEPLESIQMRKKRVVLPTFISATSVLTAIGVAWGLPSASYRNTLENKDTLSAIGNGYVSRAAKESSILCIVSLTSGVHLKSRSSVDPIRNWLWFG